MAAGVGVEADAPDPVPPEGGDDWVGAGDWLSVEPVPSDMLPSTPARDGVQELWRLASRLVEELYINETRCSKQSTKLIAGERSSEAVIWSNKPVRAACTFGVSRYYVSGSACGNDQEPVKAESIPS